MGYAITEAAAGEMEVACEEVGDPLLAYFGHHKCASSWIVRILWNVCADLGKRCEVYASMQQLREDHPGGKPPRDRVYAFMNAEYRDCLRMRPFRGIHVVRDPRDILVSAYFSHKSTHPEAETAEISITEAREALAGKDVGEGLLVELDGISRYVFDQMEAWNYSDPAIMELRMEDLSRDPGKNFRRALAHLGLYCGGGRGIMERAAYLATMAINQAAARAGIRGVRLPRGGITDPGLDFILRRLSFERLAGGRRQGVENRTSHYRKGEPGDWVNHFTPKVRQLFKDRYGDLLIRLGYETGRRW